MGQIKVEVRRDRERFIARYVNEDRTLICESSSIDLLMVLERFVVQHEDALPDGEIVFELTCLPARKIKLELTESAN